MTVSTTVHSFDYSGNGTTTIFSVQFPFKSQAHLVVKLIDNVTLAETLWTLGVDYTLSGGDPSGTLTAMVAPASGMTLHGERAVPLLQTLDLNANDGFPASAVEDAFDLLTMMLQEVTAGGGGGGGSSITLANIGSGQGVIAGLVGDQYQLKSLKVAGTGLSIASDADSITATLNGVLVAANNLSDVAARQTALDNLTAVGAATNEHVLTKDTATGNAIWKVVPTGGGGEANTSSNAGGTVGLALAKAGVNLPFRGLTAGAGITLTPSGTDVTIAGTGEANTISSVASTGSSIIPAVPKSGVDLRTKGLAATAPLQLSSNATDLTLALDLTATIGWTGKHTITRVIGDKPDYLLGLYALNNGAMPDGPPGTNVTAVNFYRTVLDVMKTSHGTDTTTGNSVAAQVQHFLSGTVGGTSRLYAGLRVAIQTNANGNPHELVGVYTAAKNNAGTKTGAWAYFCDSMHSTANDEAVSRGYATELYRSSSHGVHVGFHADVRDTTFGTVSNQPGDVGFLATSVPGATHRFLTAFSVGYASPGGYIGDPFPCQADVGFDTSAATINTAAFRMAGGHLFRLGGSTNVGDMRYSSGDTAIQMMSGGNRTFGIEDTGIPVFYETSGTIVGGAGGASALPATPVRYINVRYNTGTLAAPVIATGKIPIYAF